MLAPETVLQSRYRIIRLLGQGGMGAVYEAIDERLDTTVALKQTLFTDERLRKQFEREAKLLASLHHPALPRVSDHFAEGEGQFLVMQFIPGDDLSLMMTRKQGPFPPDQVLTWGDQLLDALDYLHTQEPQIIHRDIKPQNLKLTSRGQIILLDFGLAKGQSGGVSVVTTSASIYGYTPNYAPLEQIQGLGTDARSDIYALSATLYHLMTAVKPPDALTRAAALVNGQEDPLVPANNISNSIGPEVATVLARAMSQNRDQRYPTAAGMRAALNGTSEAATLVSKSEAATVLHAPSGATLGAQPQAETIPTMLKAGETTVVRSQSPAQALAVKRSVAPWAIGTAVVVLIGVLCGCYYAYHLHNANAAAVPDNSNQQVNIKAVNVEPSPSEHASEPGSGNVTEEKAGAVSRPQVAAETARKNEKTAKRNDKSGKTAAASDEEPDPGDESNTNGLPATPNAPEVFIPNNPGNPRAARRMGVPFTRKLKDGSQVTVLGDGTRIVTMKDGSTRMFRPAPKVFQRKRAN